jgi:hypothetical protein
MNGIKIVHKKVTLYKRVSKEFLTQEGSENETCWQPGSTVSHPRWAPDTEECGSGKFHACAAPFLADEFRTISGDRYVAISIRTADLFAWRCIPEYPHKIAFREGTVLFECDRYGEHIQEKEGTKA